MSGSWPKPLYRLGGLLAPVWLRSPLGRSRSLRVLGYHEIMDPIGFEQQIEYIISAYVPVSLDDVVGAIHGAGLPPRSVWITFDDGHANVVETGLPVLERSGVEATMFICPGLMDSDEPFWWQVVEEAARLNVVSAGIPVTKQTIADIKSLPDEERQVVVEEIRRSLEDRLGALYGYPQLTSVQFERWIGAGQRVGNHTWTHPLLDRCSPEEQERQIVAAHSWLEDALSSPPVAFAYPNGNWTEASEMVLRDLGYEAALLFDHRPTTLDEPLRLSRIRTRADGNIDRFKSMASGMHPFVHGLLGRP